MAKSAEILQKVHNQNETRQVVICKTAMEVKSNRFKGMEDTKAGQKVGLHDNNSNHGYIFAGDSDEYVLDI
ncbi:MAG: hypothetical protein IJG33_17840 [Selenomonadaceae bacterium]|nr:hypothetical protein [Selenomonadaceae bacterium]